MTQVLACASLHQAIHVSDRLVTLRAGALPYDGFANKALILVAENGVAVMGYTGEAFLDSVPTDQWIAEILRGARFERARKPPACHFGSGLRFPDLGRNLAIIRQALTDLRLTSALPLRKFADWYRSAFEISFVGWQWYRKATSRPIAGTISKPTRSLEASLCYFRRAPLACGNLAFTAVPSGNATRDEFRTLYEGLLGLPPDQVENALVAFIQHLSRTNPTVGSDCMSVRIPRPFFGPIYVRYVSPRITSTRIHGTSAAITVPVAFSPWILSDSICHAPSVVSGDTVAAAGTYHVVTSAPYYGVAVHASQERPNDPSGS